VQSNGALAADLGLNGSTLTLDPGHAAFQGLAEGAERVIDVTYDVVDQLGAAVRQSARIAVTGVNDAAVIGGVAEGLVIEDFALSASGQLTVSDLDAGEAAFLVEDVQGSYGTLSLATDGIWSYDLTANAAMQVQALDVGESLLDTMSVQTLDGTNSEIAITINGTGEASTDAKTEIFVGTVQADIFQIAAKQSLVYSGAGADQVIGGTGRDNVYGGAGNDRIEGGAKADVLSGDAGDDILRGGKGKDLLFGGEGTDCFILESKSGTDTIADFEIGLDKIVLDGIAYENLKSKSGADYVEFQANANKMRLIDVTRVDLTENHFVDTSLIL